MFQSFTRQSYARNTCKMVTAHMDKDANSSTAKITSSQAKFHHQVRDLQERMLSNLNQSATHLRNLDHQLEIMQASIMIVIFAIAESHHLLSNNRTRSHHQDQLLHHLMLQAAALITLNAHTHIALIHIVLTRQSSKLHTGISSFTTSTSVYKSTKRN